MIFAKLHQYFSREPKLMALDRMPPEGEIKLPTRLLPFCWYFIRQIKWLLLVTIILEGIIAASASGLFWFVAATVQRVEAVPDFTAFWPQHGDFVLYIGGGLVALYMVLHVVLLSIWHFVYIPFFGNLVRQQLFVHTVHQHLMYFQNDFAGRISNKIMQGGPSLRDAVKESVAAVWFASVFTVTNVILLSQFHPYLALPVLGWLVLYGLILGVYLPLMKQRSKTHTEEWSRVNGRVVDSLTNFLPVKYFARIDAEQEGLFSALTRYSKLFRRTLFTLNTMSFLITLINTLLLVVMAALGFWLMAGQGAIGAGAMALALPVALQMTFQSRWIMFTLSGVFENLGAVDEAMETLAKPHQVTDIPEALPLGLVAPEQGAKIAFKQVEFHYGNRDHKRVLSNYNLEIERGQKIGVVGRSGAGKSTLISLLVRAFDVEEGSIEIDGQNIREVQQDSLRQQIGVVTQESYLFHRSVAANIAYGKPGATREEVKAAAVQARAHEFIPGLSDNNGRTDYDAYVGERGVKLSGGQKQRIAIARTILKDAPILILDEATSALDSESELAIQEALSEIMDGKTVIAIAHRLSTLRQMDRIIVMSEGQIIEDGTHQELLKQKGHYAELWSLQSGGFIPEE